MNKTYEVGSFDETEKKANHHEASEILRRSGTGRNNTPKHHGAREVDGGFSEFVQHQVGGNYSQSAYARLDSGEGVLLCINK